MVKAQEWLDKMYPKEIRSEVREIYLSESDLEGELDLRDFTYNLLGGGSKIYVSAQVDESKVIFQNKPRGVEIIKCLNAQDYINQQYPTPKEREKEKELSFGKLNNVFNKKSLEGKLDLSDFVDLKKLDCHDNKLTELWLKNCQKLEEINCSNNELIGLDLSNLSQLRKLDCYNNKITNLNINNVTNLADLDCSYNQLVDLNLSGCSQLEEIVCNNNQLKKITFPSEIDKLTFLSLGNNNLSFHDLSLFQKMNNLKGLRIGNYRYRVAGATKPRFYNNFSGSLIYLKNLNNLQWLDISNTDINEGVKYLPKSLEKIDYSFSLRPKSKITEIKLEIDDWLYHRKKNFKFLPYSSFNDLEKIGEGGYGTIYRAEWTKSEREIKTVALKVFDKDNFSEEKFYQEVNNYELFLLPRTSGTWTIECHGISQDSSGNKIIVFEFAEEGDLRDYLKNNWKKFTFKKKVDYLARVSRGLKELHERNLVHGDFHSGNILVHDSRILISDFGTSHLSSQENGKVFGVLPYVAPELLLGNFYTQSSDVYAFGMIAYELLTGAVPYYDEDWNNLAKKVVFDNYRPDWTKSKMKFPLLLIDLIKSCWSAEPKKRPNVKELHETFDNWLEPFQENEEAECEIKKDTKFYKQCLECEEHNKRIQTKIIALSQCHPSVSLTSKKWKIVDKIQNLSISSENTTKSEDKNEIQILERELNFLKKTLDEDQQHFFVEFVNLRKEFTRNQENKEIREKIKSLNELIKSMLSKETINEIVKNCDKIVRLENEEIKEETYEVIEQFTK